MATILNNGDGTFTLTLTPIEIVAVQRDVSTSNGAYPSVVKWCEGKLTGLLLDLIRRHTEKDSIALKNKYDASSNDTKAQINALLSQKA